MFTRGDAFVILPGGFGTLEELAEVIVLRVLKYQDRPIIILNCHGFYDPLVNLFEHFIQQNFAKPKHRDLYRVVATVHEVIEAVESAIVSTDPGADRPGDSGDIAQINKP